MEWEMEMMEDRQFIEFFRQMIREEVNRKDTGPRLISVTETAEKLSISPVYLTKHVMHSSGFPKSVRLKERGDLKFFEHEVNDYILGLRKEA